MAKMIPLYSLSSQEEIGRRARLLFEVGGSPAGRDLDHWLQAEADYLEVLRRSPGALPSSPSQILVSEPQRRLKRNKKTRPENLKV